MRRRLLGGLVMLVAFAPVPAAGHSSGARCVFQARFSLSPGLALAPSRGQFTSGGPTGTITCRGSLRAGSVTGPAPFGAVGRYGTGSSGDTCETGGQGDGVQSFTIPTTGGPVPVENRITFRHGLATGQVLGGTFQGGSFSGMFTIESFEGDCVTRPMNVVVLRGEGTLAA